MASLSRVKSKSKEKNSPDCYTIQVFVTIDGLRRRRSIRLGVVSKRIAGEVRVKVAALESAAFSRTSWDPETAAWVGKIDPKLHAKLAIVGLVPPRLDAPKPIAPTLGPFLDRYIASRTDRNDKNAVKSGTAVIYGHTRRCLLAYFGADKPLAEITAGDAEDWQRWLGTEERDGDTITRAALGDNTTGRRCGIARQFFHRAVKDRLIAENPFAGLKGIAVRANRERDYFLTREDAADVIDACPDVEWKLIFALSRYGGLRCPSEHLALRWGDIALTSVDGRMVVAGGRMVVHSPKTEHHGKEKAYRVVPVFPELRPFLQAALDELMEDFDPQERKLSEQPVIARYRQPNTNLRTQLERIIKRAGLTAWPKLFQNLRASRATELAQSWPAHTAAEWLGHSVAVAGEHYWRNTDADFDKAASGDLDAATARAVHKAVHSPAGTSSHEASPQTPVLGSLGKCDLSSEFASLPVVRAGTAHPLETGENCNTPTSAVHAGGAVDPDLAAIVDAWPTLPAHVRAEVAAIVGGAAAEVGRESVK